MTRACFAISWLNLDNFPHLQASWLTPGDAGARVEMQAFCASESILNLGLGGYVSIVARDARPVHGAAIERTMGSDMTMSPSSAGKLEKLSESGLTLAEASADIRGRNVLDRNGEDVGHVSALFIDASERKVRMVEIRAGGFLGFGERHTLVPVDAIASVSSECVRLNETRDRIAGSPPYDPNLIDEPTPQSWEPFYGYYGLSPYWGSGYLYPNFPMAIHEEERARREPRDHD